MFEDWQHSSGRKSLENWAEARIKWRAGKLKDICSELSRKTIAGFVSLVGFPMWLEKGEPLKTPVKTAVFETSSSPCTPKNHSQGHQPPSENTDRIDENSKDLTSRVEVHLGLSQWYTLSSSCLWRTSRFRGAKRLWIKKTNLTKPPEKKSEIRTPTRNVDVMSSPRLVTCTLSILYLYLGCNM